MGFESSGERNFAARSPGGFEFGLQGWTWGDPKPTSITFFLDNTAMVCDQYGRQILRAVAPDGREVRFADKPPDGNREGTVVPRPQFATHRQTLEALGAERINWLAYEVKWVTKTGDVRGRGGMTQEEAMKLHARMVREDCRVVTVAREISCAGWPQLPYDELRKLPELPPTPEDDLRKILDPALRRDALRARSEADAVVKEDEAELRAG